MTLCASPSHTPTPYLGSSPPHKNAMLSASLVKTYFFLIIAVLKSEHFGNYLGVSKH
jgi:hypothetical protein